MTNELKNTKEQFSSKATVAIVASFIAVWVFGIMPIMIRWSEAEISPTATMFNRCWIAALIFGLWQGLSLIRQRWVEKQPTVKQPLNKNQILLLILTAAFFCTTQILWAWSLAQTSVANSSLLHSLTPIFTVLGGYLLFKQQFDLKFLVGLVIASIGTIVLGFNDLQLASLKFQGDLIALLSTLFWGAYFLGIEKLRTELATTTILSWVSWLVTPLLALVLFFSHETWLPYSWGGWLSVIVLALTLVFGHGLLAYSLKYLPSSLVAMINLLDPIVTTILAWIIFAEALGWLNLVAFAIILLGIYLALTSEKGTEAQIDDCKQPSLQPTDQL